MSENRVDGDVKSPLSKIFSIICTVLTVIVIAITVFIVINLIVCRAQNRPVSFFGTSFAIVQTNSMEPEIKVGDLVVYKSTNYADIKVGDNIVFYADDNFSQNVRGQSIVHRVIEVTEEGIKTRGINNAGEDKGLREANEILGVCTLVSTGLGKAFSIIGKYGIFIIIAIVAVPIIVKQSIRIFKLARRGDDENKKAEANGGSGFDVSFDGVEGFNESNTDKINGENSVIEKGNVEPKSEND